MPVAPDDGLLLPNATTDTGDGYAATPCAEHQCQTTAGQMQSLPPSMCANFVWYNSGAVRDGSLHAPAPPVAAEPYYADAFDHNGYTPANLENGLVQLLPQRRPHHWIEEDQEEDAMTPRGRSVNADKCELSLSPFFKRLRIDDSGASGHANPEKESCAARQQHVAATASEAMEVEEPMPTEVADMSTDPLGSATSAAAACVTPSPPPAPQSASPSGRSVPLQVWKEEMQRRAREERRRYMQDLRTCEMGMIRRAC